MIKNYYTYLFAFGHFCSDINQTALSALLPFLIATYHFDYTTAALLVMVSNIIGSLVQPLLGQLADKKNCPWIMVLGLFLAGGGMALTGLIPTIVLLAMTSNVYLATLLLLPMGVAIQVVYSPMVVLGQQYLPNHVGLASGVTLGLAVSIGGLFAPCLGMIADNLGLITTMYVIAAIAVIPMVVAFILPSEKKED